MSINKSGQPYSYEILICRAFGFDNKTEQNGADAGIFNTLILSETTPMAVKHLKKSHTVLLNEVKGYLLNAIDKLSRDSANDKHKQTYALMKARCYEATNSDELFSVIEMDPGFRED